MQLSLFPTTKREVQLIAQSKKVAFYRLLIVEEMGDFMIVKESGAAGKILDVRKWPMKSFEDAERKFNRIIREKTRKNRSNPRKYFVVPGGNPVPPG